MPAQAQMEVYLNAVLFRHSDLLLSFIINIYPLLIIACHVASIIIAFLH
jgi:hypothetical protein